MHDSEHMFDARVHGVLVAVACRPGVDLSGVHTKLARSSRRRIELSFGGIKNLSAVISAYQFSHDTHTFIVRPQLDHASTCCTAQQQQH